MDSCYIKDGNKLYIKIPMKKDKNVYWRQGKGTGNYGASFATANKNNKYSSSCYAEWLIGYDATESDLKKHGGKSKKETSLKKKKFLFTGANGKKKYPYQLSEILYEMIRMKLVSKDEIKGLIKTINKQKESTLDIKYKIKPQTNNDVTIEGMPLSENSITLPTFVYKDESFPGVSVEIVIQKQQKGSSTQPLLYLDIPITCLMNYKKKYIGKNYKDLSEDDQNGRLEINKNNKDCILKIFQLFSICSANHKHDVKEILSKLAQ